VSLQPPTRPRVLLADLPGPARRALADLLEEMDGVELVGQVSSGDELGHALDGTRPDVLVIDDRLLRAGGASLPTGPRLIVIGVDDDPGFAARAEALGADAWMVKDGADEQLPALLMAA
jgi:DNA-binding NarL/FixJ family response regulator